MDWKRLLNKLLYPPVWLILLLTAVSAAALAAVFLRGLDESPIAYAVYVLSFYTVSVLTLACVKTFPRYFKSAKGKIYSYDLGRRYMTDAAFKTRVNLYRSLILNLLYVAVNLLSGLLYGSVWFTILAVYYATLAIMRFLLLRTPINVNRQRELRRARLCSMILITLNLALSGAVLMIMYQGRGFDYPGILIYVMAAYTFYITGSAIRNLIKYKKYNSPIMSASRVISMAAALVSMLSLETAMLTQFGAEMDGVTRNIFIAATGAGISAVVVVMAVYMIVKTTKEIRKI